MTMANSVELRCPMLDTEFAAFSARLGTKSKLNSKGELPNLKASLKKAFVQLLPSGLAMRRKRGFSIPAYEWLQTALHDRARHELERSDSFAASILPIDARRHLMDRAMTGHETSQRRVWGLIVLNKWSERWL
jgi:asparagine synthetase B (glutamine-hydrolysing)